MKRFIFFAMISLFSMIPVAYATIQFVPEIQQDVGIHQEEPVTVYVIDNVDSMEEYYIELIQPEQLIISSQELSVVTKPVEDNLAGCRPLLLYEIT